MGVRSKSKLRRDTARQPVRESQRPAEESQGLNTVAGRGADEECWHQDIDTLRQAAAKLARRGNNLKRPVPAVSADDSFHRIAASLDDSSSESRSVIVRALYDLDPDRAASFFNLALRDGSPEDRRQLGAALAGSGLVKEAIEDLMSESRENSYGAFSLLFLVAKAGEVQPLMQLIDSHPSVELRVAVIKLLASSREPEIVPTFRRLAMSSSMPPEVRAAAREAIDQINDPASESAPSAA